MQAAAGVPRLQQACVQDLQAVSRKLLLDAESLWQTAEHDWLPVGAHRVGTGCTGPASPAMLAATGSTAGRCQGQVGLQAECCPPAAWYALQTGPCSLLPDTGCAESRRQLPAAQCWQLLFSEARLGHLGGIGDGACCVDHVVNQHCHLVPHIANEVHDLRHVVG